MIDAKKAIAVMTKKKQQRFLKSSTLQFRLKDISVAYDKYDPKIAVYIHKLLMEELKRDSSKNENTWIPVFIDGSNVMLAEIRHKPLIIHHPTKLLGYGQTKASVVVES